MKRFVPAILVALAAAALACSTTTFQSTWRDPEAEPLRLEGSKVLAVFMGKNAQIRRRAEDALAREISARGAQGVAGYTVLSDEETKDPDSARPKLERMGFAGVVTMRIAGSETQYSVSPSYWGGRPYYRHFWGGYWGWGWRSVWEPAYLQADKVVSVETLVYSLRQDRLVWAGMSRTVDPAQVETFIADLSKAVTSQMEKDGLLRKA
jgi:hypothetical protein